MAKEKGSIKERERVFTNYPKHYKVIMHNDDFTPMEFVVALLKEVFFKPASEAMSIMLAIHNQGKMVVGVYSYDMAVSMTNKATARAREYGYPLLITYEPE